MRPTMRSYEGDEDYWRIREFLREVFLRNERREASWQPYRFDYWRWHGVANLEQGPLTETVFIWEDDRGGIAAVLNVEEAGQAHMQVDPRTRTAALEEEMIETAECRLAVEKDGRSLVCVWAPEGDEMREGILERRGYRRHKWQEHQRHRPLSDPILDAEPAEGYAVRALGDGAELLERCYCSGLAFHPDDIAYAVENREDVSWYRSIQNAPLYRRDLDIVAVARDGAVAAFCTIWFDDVTRTGAFEPVGTAPAHQRRGLGKAVMCEGLRRLRRTGATTAFVGSYEPAAHGLYASVGFTEYDVSQQWLKEL